MEKYKEVLEKIADKEMSSTIFWVVVLFIIIGVVWVSNYFYFKKMKNNHPKKYDSKKQIKVRRQSVWASIALSGICIGLGVFLYLDAANTVSNINKDIEENSYSTYIGSYYIYDSYYSKNIYDRWLSVDFDNDDYALIYMNSFFEWISTEKGEFEGKVVMVKIV